VSEPKKVRRWYCDSDWGSCGEEEHKNGHLVLYEDFQLLESENARLKAEVEKLTKAGDDMALCLNCPTCAKNWNAAKGVQS